MITSIKDYTTQQLEYFASYRSNGLFDVQFTDDNKTIVSKKKYKIIGTETGHPDAIEDGLEVIAHIQNADYQAEIDNCQKRIDLIKQFCIDEGIAAQ